MTKKRVVAIPGEDAAPEAFHPTVALVDATGAEIDWRFPRVGREARVQDGEVFPPAAREAIDAADSVLFGSTSGPSAPALFYLRWGKGTYANVRPARYLPGFRSPLREPEAVDFVIVRENLEDAYVRVEGDLDALAALALESPTLGAPLASLAPGRFAIKAISEVGTGRVARFAFELARRRKREGRRGRVTCGTKHNMLVQSDGLFRDITLRVAREYPEIEVVSLIVDDLAHRLIARPAEFDVVLLPNLYGDVLSDAAAALIGGLGLAPSGCYGDDFAYFESAHGSAPDLAGQGTINPTATILSAAMMLEYLGFADAAERLERALTRVYAESAALTPDQGGDATTEGFCDAVRAAL